MSTNIPGYEVIPQIEGPPLELFGDNCFLALENGDLFELENGRGVIQLQTCRQPPAVTWLIQLEDASGYVLLEDGFGYIELERGP